MHYGFPEPFLHAVVIEGRKMEAQKVKEDESDIYEPRPDYLIIKVRLNARSISGNL